jgi:transposase-like protein
MRQKSGLVKEPAEKVVKEIRRLTRRQFSAEEKIRIILEGLRGEESIAELCRREGIVQNLYYRWSKDFLEAGKKGLAGDTARAATSRGQGPSPRGVGFGGGRGRTDARKSSAQKKRDRGWGRRGMRYSASEKAEIIRLVGQSALPVKRTLEKLGIPRATFYRWYDLYQSGGPEALDDSIDARKHAIDRHYGIFGRASAAQPIVTIDSEIDLITARRKRVHELLGRLAVVLDDENATPPTCHAFASPIHCQRAFDPIILS